MLIPLRHTIASAIALSCLLTGTLRSADDAATQAPTELAPPTHKQVRIIEPALEGESLMLHTFCLHPSGDLWMCCSSRVAVRASVPAVARVTTPAAQEGPAGWVVIYTPEGAVRKSIPLDFTPTAINLAPSGECFVAGGGSICKLDSAGEIIKAAATPNVGDMETFKREVEKGTRERYQQLVVTYTKQVEAAQQRINAIEAMDEDKRTEQIERQLKTSQTSLTRYQSLVKQYEKMATAPVNVDALVKSRLGVTGLAVSEQDVFVSCKATAGYGYDIWRVDHDLAGGKAVLTGERGCCGQMDIQCCGNDLMVAENTKFAVTTYDRDGNQKATFGQRDPKSINGFGSCCNPMNLCQEADGSILTAESSIGNIKKYDAGGNLLAYIGKAKIGGGCKHCALAHDAKRDWYYMQHEDAHHICVLVPVDEAPEFTQDELQAKQAREGLGQKLIGTWKQDGAEDAQKPTTGVRVISTVRLGTSMEFLADGTLKMVGGIYGNASDLEWRAVKQSENTLDIAMSRNLVESYSYRIEFQSDDEAKISMLYSDRVLGSGNYRRVK